MEIFQEQHFDAILMDIQMPIMDGITATHRIREIETERNADNPAQPERTPIVAMTANAMKSDREGRGSEGDLKGCRKVSKSLEQEHTLLNNFASRIRGLHES